MVGEGKVTYIVANVYAPNLQNQTKVEFFKKVIDEVLEFEEIPDCNYILIVSDLNLTFHQNEVKNKSPSKGRHKR